MIEFSHQDLLSINDIISDVARICNDEAFRKRSIGYYKRQVKNAIDELSIETPFVKQYKDLDISRKIAIPSGCWEINNMWVYNGECCNIESARELHWKRNFQLLGEEGWFSNNKPNQEDNFTRGKFDISNVYFFNIQNGYIIFSENCLDYSKVRIEFNGYASDLDVNDAKIVPKIVREAIVYKTAKSVLLGLLHTDNTYYGIYNNVKAELDAPYVGLWDKAKGRIKKMGAKKRSDMRKYYNRPEI